MCNGCVNWVIHATLAVMCGCESSAKTSAQQLPELRRLSHTQMRRAINLKFMFFCVQISYPFHTHTNSRTSIALQKPTERKSERLSPANTQHECFGWRFLDDITSMSANKPIRQTKNTANQLINGCDRLLWGIFLYKSQQPAQFSVFTPKATRKIDPIRSFVRFHPVLKR